MREDNWQVGRGAPHCSACEREFARGQAFYSALTENGDELSRHDFCRPCWEGADRGEFFCHWRTRRRDDDKPRRVGTEVVMELFEKLGGESEGASRDRAEMRFVLALYLTRRKALKLLGTARRGDTELLRFRRPGVEEDDILVENPQLDDGQIDAATARLKDLLQGDL